LKQLLAVAPQEIDARDKDDRTPLIWAASSGNLEALMTLITAKSDVSLQDKDGLTALHCAASRGFLECLEALITFGGAVVDAPDSNGCSPLFYAVTLGHADCVQFLLSNEAFVNQQDRRGRTAAHCGSTKGQLETIKILYNKGGNLWLRNVKGDFPLHEAVRSGRKDLVVWLLNHSPEGLLDFGNKGGKTPLHVASLENNVELAKVLIDYGLNVNSVMRLKGGLLVTPLDICLQKGFRSCAKFLLLHGALPSSKLDASRAGEGPSPTVYSRRFPDHQHHRQSDSDSGGAGYSSSIGFQSHYNGYHSSFHHNHTHTSESSNSLREVVLPITHHKQNPVVNGERGGRASRVSQRVKVFAEIPGTPSTVLSTATDSESTPHTMITNVYVSAYPAPRAMGSRKKLKKIRRRGGSKSRSPSVCRETQEPHSVDIWKAGDQEETNGSESEATRSSSLIDPLDLPEKIARDSIVEALQVIENGSSELTSTSEEVAQKDEKDRIRLEREIEPESEGHFLNVSTPEVEETISSLVLSKTPEAVDLEKNERLQTEADAEQNAGQEHKAEKQETAHANESFIAEKTDQNNNSDKTLKVTENKEVESFESQGDLVCDESPLQSPLLSFPDPLQDSSSFQSTQDIVGVKEEVPKEDSVKERAKRSVEHEEEKATSQGQQETSEQQENVQLGPIPPTLSSPLPVSDISITTSERDNLRTPSPLMLQPQMSILQTGDEEQGEIHLVVPNLTEEERSRSISPLDVNEYRESDLSSLPLIREVSEAEAVKIQQELIESQLKRESSEEKSQDANNNEKTKIPRPKKVVKKKTVIAEPMDPTKKLSLRPKGRGKWDKKVIGTPHDKVLPLTDKDRETAEDTLDEMTSIDTDDSNLKEMEEKKRQRRKQNQETRDEITEEVVFDLPSGQRIRATTTLELKTPVKKNDLFDDDENDEDRGDRKYATLPRISKGRKRDVEKRGMSSQCTHRLHRKQSLKPVPPIDLRNVKSKVDSKTPETFGLIRKSPSFHGKTTLSAAQPTDSRMDMNRFAHELSRSSKK
jgi:ankyrin repeat protein